MINDLFHEEKFSTTVIYLRINSFGDQVCRVDVLGSIFEANKILSCVKDRVRIRGSDRLSVTVSFPTLDRAAEDFASSVGDDLCT